MAVIQTYSFECLPCCSPTVYYCHFCPDGTDLPSTFDMTISGSPVVTGTYTHDYTIFDGTYTMVQSTMTGTTVVPDSTVGTWHHYSEAISSDSHDGFYFCYVTTKYFEITCSGSTTSYLLNGMITITQYLSMSPISDCAEFISSHSPTGNVYYYAMTGTDFYTPTNNGSYGLSDALTHGTGFPNGNGTVDFATGDACDPLYLSNHFVGQLSNYFYGLYQAGHADNVTASMTITLHP